MKVSYSRFSSYLSCPYKHHLAYNECLKAKKVVRPLVFGTDFHKLLELRSDPRKVAKALKSIEGVYYNLPAGQQTELGENYIEDLTSIFEDYLEVYLEAKVPSVTEQKFELEIGSIAGEKVIFVGVIDEAYKSKVNGDRQLKIGEHKTFNQRPDMNTLVMNAQKCLYAKASLFLYGVLPKSVIWDYIRSTPAAYPVWLSKSGKFSEANSQQVTPMSWRRACEIKHIDDEKIIAIGDKYKGNIVNYFFRCELETVPEMVDDIWDGFRYISREIVLRGGKNKTKNMTRDCKFCSYRDICYTEMTGGNRNDIIAQAYVVSPRDEEEPS